MTYGIVFDITAPVELYDQMHQELLSRAGTSIEGLLVHIGRPTSTGFQIIEVWDSKDRLDHYNRTLVWPMMAELGVTGPAGMPPQAEEEFEVRGLLLPSGGVGF
jgi:hypothetical protein